MIVIYLATFGSPGFAQNKLADHGSITLEQLKLLKTYKDLCTHVTPDNPPYYISIISQTKSGMKIEKGAASDLTAQALEIIHEAKPGSLLIITLELQRGKDTHTIQLKVRK